MSKKLFEDDYESDEELSQFTTNKDYANNYNKFRSKELSKKLKDKAKNNADSSSSSSSDSSDDDDENPVLNPEFDEAFFKTLASLKNKDPSIYNNDIRFFDEFDAKPQNERKTDKALSVKDYQREILLKKGGIYEDDESKTDDEQRSQSPSYTDQQKQLKNELKKAFHDDDGSDDEDKWGGIFKKRTKSKEEVKNEEDDYAKWLKSEDANVGENTKHLNSLKKYWSNPKISKDEAFLRDYILSNGYANRNANEIPTYENIVGKDADSDADDKLELSDDEAELEKQAEFERQFNFRFEEPDQEFIKRYPRTVDHSVRKTDTRRKEKRVELKERKKQEKEEKMRELEMVNAMRKREIEEKIMQLKAVAGEDNLPFNDADLDEDFDPDEYDRKMQNVFNNEYYQIDEGENKPECPDNIEDLKVEDWDNYDPADDEEMYGNAAGGHCEDDDFNMDCDYDPEMVKKSLKDELLEGQRDRRKKRKRKSKFVEMLKQPKPVFNPELEKTYGEYLDEYYKLDYEDIIGDTPCRFKYVETVPNDFGLTVEEILMSKNKELNQWASLKKATQIRPKHVEENEVKMYRLKAKNLGLKKKIFLSLFEEPSEEKGSGDEELKSENAKNDNSVKTTKNRKNDAKTEEYEVNDSAEKSEEIIIKQKIKNTTTNKQNNISENVQSKVEVKEKKKKKKPNENVTTKKTLKENSIDVEQQSTEVKDKLNETSDLVAKVNIDNQKLNKKTKKILDKNQNKQENVHKKVNVKLQSKVKNKKNQQKAKHLQSKSITIAKYNKPFSKSMKNKLKNNKTIKPKSTQQNRKSTTDISDERLRAFGLNPKKYHKKLKYNQNNKSPGSAANKSKSTVKVNNQDAKHKQKLKKFLQQTGTGGAN